MPLNEKENFMKVMRGETPEWVPRYYMGADPYATKPQQCATLASSAVPGTIISKGKGRVDVFGVEYIATEETGWQMLPVPGKFILEDVRYWRNVVRLPDLTGIDWDYLCKKDVERFKVNTKETAVIYGSPGGFFMPLMNLMGFTNGLMAMYEEPEAVEEMFDYMCNWYCYILERTMDRYPVDIFSVGDDTATAQNPFISPATYRNLIKPFMFKVTQIARDRGLPIMMHNCGRCEDSIPDWVDFGVCAWNPAQVMNDLPGIKKKYGNKMVLTGCWDSSGPAGYPGASEDLIRQTVRGIIDKYASGGGFIFWGSTYGPPTDQDLINKRKWMTSEYEAYREHPYK
jgi:hypothetical protein